jgi:hypothetical protein
MCALEKEEAGWRLGINLIGGAHLSTGVREREASGDHVTGRMRG